MHQNVGNPIALCKTNREIRRSWRYLMRLGGSPESGRAGAARGSGSIKEKALATGIGIAESVPRPRR